MRAIAEEAARIHRQYGAEDMDYVAGKLGVDVHEVLGEGGVKEAYFPDLRSVVLRPGLPSHERRYLIAHALGHHLFHRDMPSAQPNLHQDGYCGRLVSQRGEVPESEKEADAFAAHLLVPEDKLRPMLGEEWVRTAEDPALKLALEFRTPVELMRERLILEAIARAA